MYTPKYTVFKFGKALHWSGFCTLCVWNCLCHCTTACPTGNIWQFQLLHIRTNIWCCIFLILAILVYVVSKCSFNLHFPDDNWCWIYLFTSSHAVHMHSFMRYLLKSFAHFWVVCLTGCKTCPLSEVCTESILSHLCLFILLTVYFDH